MVSTNAAGSRHIVMISTRRRSMTRSFSKLNRKIGLLRWTATPAAVSRCDERLLGRVGQVHAAIDDHLHADPAPGRGDQRIADDRVVEVADAQADLDDGPKRSRPGSAAGRPSAR